MADNSLTQSEQQAPKTAPLKCGDVGTYKELKKRKTNRQERDHVPATSSMLAAAEPHFEGLSGRRKRCLKRGIKMEALTIAIPKGTHVKYSRTCKGRGGKARLEKDVKDLKQAAKDDLDAVQPQLSAECAKKYEEARKQVLAQDPEELFEKVKKKCLAG